MRVVVSIQQDVFGGPHNQWQQILPHLEKRGIEVVFVLPGEAPGATDRLRLAGAKVYNHPTTRLRLALGVRKGLLSLPEIRSNAESLAKLVQDVGADIVVACGLANLPAAVAARRAGRPLVWQLLSVFAPWYVRTGLGALVANFSNAVMTVGARCRRAHPPLALVRKNLVEFVPPVNLEEFTPATRVAGARLVVGTVGNFNPHKGHDLLWEAAATLWTRGHDFDLVIAGQSSPSYEHEYRVARDAWLASLPASWRQRVRYVEPKGSVAPILKDLDVFVLPSRSEGVPTVLLEAMASGLPCVAFDVGGISEVMSNEREGLSAGPPSAGRLANRLEDLLNSGELRTFLAKAARVRATKEFAAEVCAERHVVAIKKCSSN